MKDQYKSSIIPVIKWLLEEENPSVRYLTLRDLLNRREGDPELKAAKTAIPTSKVITKIFSKQKPEGYWEEPANPYHGSVPTGEHTLKIRMDASKEKPFQSLKQD